jgi:hypothetical protein
MQQKAKKIPFNLRVGLSTSLQNFIFSIFFSLPFLQLYYIQNNTYDEKKSLYSLQ